MMCTGYGGYSYKDSYELMSKAVDEYLDNYDKDDFDEDYIFTYNILDEYLTKKITERQPKMYGNSEFYVPL